MAKAVAVLQIGAASFNPLFTIYLAFVSSGSVVRSNEVGCVHFSFRRVFCLCFCEQRTVFWGTPFFHVTLISKKISHNCAEVGKCTALPLSNGSPLMFQLSFKTGYVFQNCRIHYSSKKAANERKTKRDMPLFTLYQLHNPEWQI